MDQRYKFAQVFEGEIVCPGCAANIGTPIESNPFNGKKETMVLIPNRPGRCALCKTEYVVNEEQAFKHNAFWYPQDYKEKARI